MDRQETYKFINNLNKTYLRDFVGGARSRQARHIKVYRYGATERERERDALGEREKKR